MILRSSTISGALGTLYRTFAGSTATSSLVRIISRSIRQRMATEQLLVQERVSRPPQFSVVIPMHNAEAWVTETLASVCLLEDSATPFEIIVVDDGSTDGGADVAVAFLSQQGIDARVLRTTNGGPSRARNIGWRSARGSWIQFLDADDLLDPRKLEYQGGACVAAQDTTAVIYSDWCRLELREGSWTERLPRCSPRVSENTLESLIRAENFLQLGCALFRRRWLEAVGGFNEEQWVIEDVNLLIRIALAGGFFTHVPTTFPVLYYRQHPQSLSRRRNDLFAGGCHGNAKLVERHWSATGVLTPARRALLGQIYLFSASLVAADAPDLARAMLNEVAGLTLGAAARSRAARRVFFRAVAYWCLGRNLACKCERAYLRTVAPIRKLSTRRRPAVESERAQARAASA